MMHVSRRSVAVAIAVVAIGMQLVRPARTNPVAAPSDAIASHVPVPPDVARVLQRSCGDCHSNGTAWPWYTEVAPVSWFVTNHVTDGRRHLNYQEWGRYDSEKQQRLLKKTCEEVRSGGMPVGSYLWIHRDARLTEADVNAICAWTGAQ
jgi:hypothetical protein